MIVRKKKLFYLAVVKGALHCDVVHIGVRDGGHLRLLDGRYATFGVQDEYRHIFLPLQPIDRCTVIEYLSTVW